jgi:hypothetical protein
MAGQNMKRLSSMCRHDNRLLRDTVAKFWRILPVFDGEGLGYPGPMPDCWFQRENKCESCLEKVVMTNRMGMVLRWKGLFFRNPEGSDCLSPRRHHLLAEHRLDRIHRQQSRLHLAGLNDNGLDAVLGGDVDLFVLDPEMTRPHPDLLHRFLAGDVQHLKPLDRQRGEQLQNERRLADAGIAADEYKGARHDTAAQHPVHLSNIGHQTGVLLLTSCCQGCAVEVVRPWRTEIYFFSSVRLSQAPQSGQRHSHLRLSKLHRPQTKSRVSFFTMPSLD